MRPIVIAGAFIAALWTLVNGISAFRNVPYFHENDAHLTVFYIITGSIYMGIVAIECFGIFASASRKLALVRLYAYLSVLVTLMIAAAGIIQTIIHFSFKNDIINLCSNVNTGDRIFFTGFFGPIDGGVVSSSEAEEWCRRQWDRNSFSNIVSLLATTAVAAIFSIFVFAYLRQLHDPTSVVNVSREPARFDVYPARYNPPFNPPYNTAFQYQPPQGPPPNMSVDAFVPAYEGSESKPPTYEGGDFKGGFGDHKDDPFSDGRIRA